MKRTYSRIDMDERRKIARWRTAGISVDVIAEKLGRHRSTIFRELRRNVFEDAAVGTLSSQLQALSNGRVVEAEYCAACTSWQERRRKFHGELPKS
jgi:IS30 family transposase